MGHARHAAGTMPCIARSTGPGERRALRGLGVFAVAACTTLPTRGAVSGQRHGDGRNPRHIGDGLLRGQAQGLELAGADRIHRDGEIDLALVDDDLGDEAERDDVLSEVWAFDALQRFDHAVFGHGCGHCRYVCLLRLNTNCLIPVPMRAESKAQGSQQLAPAHVLSRSLRLRRGARSPA